MLLPDERLGFYRSHSLPSTETKQRTLEELDYIFAVPTRVFMRYQLTKALPWWFKRWVLFRKDAKLEPLYQLDVPEGSNGTANGNEKAFAEQREHVNSREGQASGSDRYSSH